MSTTGILVKIPLQALDTIIRTACLLFFHFYFIYDVNKLNSLSYIYPYNILNKYFETLSVLIF